MTYAAGQPIQAADYNTLRSQINEVFADLHSGATGISTAGWGYGQTDLTTNATAGVKIRAENHTGGTGINASSPGWGVLFDQLNQINRHQTGANLITGTNDPTLAQLITYLNTVSTTLPTLRTNKFNVHATQVQLSNLTGVSSSRTDPWDGVLTHTIEVSGSNWNHLRYFFNSGGQIRFAPSCPGGGTSSIVGTLDYYYKEMLSNIGDIIFDYQQCYANGSAPGSGTANGFYDLTNAYQIVWQKTVSASVYTQYGTEYVTLKARLNNTPGTANTIIFLMEFFSDNTQDIVSAHITNNVSERKSVDAIVVAPLTYTSTDGLTDEPIPTP